MFSPSAGSRSRNAGSSMGYQTKRHLGHLQSHSQLYCGPRVPEPVDTTNPITVGGYEEVGSLGDTNEVNSYFVGDRDPQSPQRSRILNANNYDATITSKDRALSREIKATKQRFGFVANASNTHNTNTGAAKNRTLKNQTLLRAAEPGIGGTNIPSPEAPVVHITVPSGEVAKITLDDPTVGGLKEFFAAYGDKFFQNIRRRETFTAQANFLGHTNLTLNQVAIPMACIRVSPTSNPTIELHNDGQHLSECDFKVTVTRKTKQFGPHDDLFTLDDLEDCRIYLYQNVGEPELNRLTPCEISQVPKASVLHKLIKRGRENACLAVLEDTVRFRRETLNHSPNMETALMAASRAKMESVAIAVLERADFGGINTAEAHFKKDPNFQPRTDVSELKKLEGSIVPDGALTALDIACINKLDDVASYICSREDFVEVNNISPGNYTSLMHAVHNELPKAAVAILARPDFRVLKVRNTQMIECTAYQMAKKKADKPYRMPKDDPELKKEILNKCDTFANLCRRMEKHPSFVMDMANKFTRS